MSVSTIVAGLDVGNGYVKGLVEGRENEESSIIDVIDLPSGVSHVTRSNPITLSGDEAVEFVKDDFFNNLDVQFTTPLVTNPYRHIFGKRGLSTDGVFDEFDLIGKQSKADQELSNVLILGCLAGKVLKDYVSVHNALPTEMLCADAYLSIALPINEYLSYRDVYASRLKEKKHIVSFATFDDAVMVALNIVDVLVMAEGASAQFAIKEKGEKLIDVMLADVRSHGLALEGITAADVLGASNVIGVDVGEGTVNFPVFTDNKFNTDASDSFNQGYGSALNNALKSMEQQRFNAGFTSRKQLADYLQTQPSAIKRNVYNKIKQFVDTEAVFLAQSIADSFGKVLSVVGARTEVVYVYGGGSGPLKEVLYPALLAKVTAMTGEDAFPVLYLDSSYSRALNREGLFSMAKMIATKGK